MAPSTVSELSNKTTNTSYVPQSSAFLVTSMGDGAKPVQRMVLVRADATEARALR